MSFPTSDILTGGPFTEAVRIKSIRLLAGNLQPETIPDDEIKIIIIRKDNKTFKATNKYDWVDTDREFPMIIDVSNCYTAIELLRGIGDSESLTTADALALKVISTLKLINNVTTEFTEIPDVQTTGGFNSEQGGTFI